MDNPLTTDQNAHHIKRKRRRGIVPRPLKAGCKTSQCLGESSPINPRFGNSHHEVLLPTTDPPQRCGADAGEASRHISEEEPEDLRRWRACVARILRRAGWETTHAVLKPCAYFVLYIAWRRCQYCGLQDRPHLGSLSQQHWFR